MSLSVFYLLFTTPFSSILIVISDAEKHREILLQSLHISIFSRMLTRKFAQITNSKAHPGFLGDSHLADHVINGTALEYSDPFILLMDAQLDLSGTGVVGGAHPHAGFEIATPVLEGETGAGLHGSKAGDLEWLAAGRAQGHEIFSSGPFISDKNALDHSSTERSLGQRRLLPVYLIDICRRLYSSFIYVFLSTIPHF